MGDFVAGCAWIDDPYEAAEDADPLVILTEWNEFRAPDLGRIAKWMSTTRLADLRNISAPEDTLRAGFEAYDAVGRKNTPEVSERESGLRAAE